MKKFTSLFALLSILLGASAETLEATNLKIQFEAPDDSYKFVYVWSGNGENANNKIAGNWPGSDMGTPVATTSEGKKIYEWVFNNANAIPEKILFHNNNGSQTKDFQFVNNAYYINGAIAHYIGEEGNFETIYFYNKETNWNNIYLYPWSQSISGGYPGLLMEKIGNSQLYKCQINTDIYSNILFTNGYDGDDNKTGDLTIEDNKVYSKSGNINVTLEEGKDFPFETSFTANTAHYERSIGVGVWGTLCLPFPISGSNDYVTFYQLSSVSSEAMTFAPITTTPIPAGTPMLFKRIQGDENNTTLWIDEKNVEIDPTPNPVTKDGWTTNGTFTKLENQSNVYIVYGTQIHKGTSKITINPYRAWFTNTSASGAPLRIEEAGTEGLQYVEQEDGTVKAYYDLQGRKLDGARKGLVIENGKIIMVK